MNIYHFEFYADGKDFYAEFEIKGDQNFEQLHKIIISSLGLANSEMASFYVCDNNWDKEKEITLFDMKLDTEEYPIDYILTMDKTKIEDVINEKYKNIDYVYDFLNMKTFKLELINIHDSESAVEYPRCINCDEIIEKIDIEENIEFPVEEDIDDIENFEELPDDIYY